MSLPPKTPKIQSEIPAVGPADDHGITRWKLALGAASLFFFVVGVKRSFRTDDGREILKSDADLLVEQRTGSGKAARGESRPGARDEPGGAAGKKPPKALGDVLRTARAQVKRGREDWEDAPRETKGRRR